MQHGRGIRRRTLLAGFALGAALLTAFPDMGQQLAQVPLLSWLLAGVGALLLWQRD